MSDLLAEVEEHYGPPPRRVGLFQRLSLRARSPFWLPASDQLMQVYHRQDFLLKEGEVTWGALVQANSLLFRDGLGDHPAVAIYSTDPALGRDPDRLRAVVGRVSALRGTIPADPDQRRYAAIISDEQDHSLHVPVPRSCSGGREAISTTLMVRRKHLPRGRLEDDTFPLLIHPETPATLILPSCFWPESYLRHWSGEATA